MVAMHVRYESEPQLTGNEKAGMRAKAQVHALYTMSRQVRYWRGLTASSLHLCTMITRHVLEVHAHKRHRRRRKNTALQLAWCCVPSPQSNIHTFPDDSFKLQASCQFCGTASPQSKRTTRMTHCDNSWGSQRKCPETSRCQNIPFQITSKHEQRTAFAFMFKCGRLQCNPRA